MIGNDVDQAMREQAARRCAGLPNVTITGDAWTDSEETFDLVTMIASLHHLDVAEALHQVRQRLSPGGRFLAVGLAQPRTVPDHAWDVASMLTNPIIGYVKHPWPSRAVSVPPPPFPVRDPTLSLNELRQLLDEVMPGAVVRRRLGFRHTIAWTKPHEEVRSLVTGRAALRRMVTCSREQSARSGWRSGTGGLSWRSASQILPAVMSRCSLSARWLTRGCRFPTLSRSAGSRSS